MIKSFANSATRRLFETGRSPRIHPDLARAAVKKMIQLDSAAKLSDLAIPPANRLEILEPKQRGRYSLRVSKQWRITFTWTNDGNAEEVELIDYH